MRFASASLLMAAASTAWCAGAFAQELPASLRACATEADAARRLACYDRQIPPQTAPAVATSVARPDPASASAPAPSAAAPLLHISAIAVRPRMPPEYTLDNGEVWRQVDNAPFSIDVGATVTVQRGPLGSLWMQTDPRHGTRVARVH